MGNVPVAKTAKMTATPLDNMHMIVKAVEPLRRDKMAATMNTGTGKHARYSAFVHRIEPTIVSHLELRNSCLRSRKACGCDRIWSLKRERI
jgi:hypothetical protein